MPFAACIANPDLGEAAALQNAQYQRMGVLRCDYRMVTRRFVIV